ncbi:efflux transporter outer membrane subunit [Desulfobotulus sp. H1]|uniref:Efflux transporter outer membrane subunit n=1 Tax=Desulfobotulus pelophilus TaxID=2823377 RepID=A0ABT3N5F3_9BACT|nr:efflux transporter outer membrane subunit [Desulfobotulus pelophilus]MCW7752688.1 efflux transporter outer membrane subunit [Desulfobotulus pelophilus]
MLRWIHVLVLLSFFFGCTARQYPTPEGLPEGLPAAYEVEVLDEGASVQGWWELFGDRELVFLVEEALRRNYDIREAFARLEAAAADFGSVRAGELPDLTMTGEVGQQRTRNSETGQTRSSERYNTFLAASYEVDLWGRVAAASAAEGERFRASREDLESAAMTVAATVAEVWVARKQTLAHIDLVRVQLEEEKALLSIEEARFVSGMSSALDVLRQKETVLATTARLPDLKAELRLQQHRLALLTGRAASGFRVGEDVSGDALVTVPLPATGLPLELLEQRPDIRAAHARLVASGWDLEATKALRLPKLTLSARAGLTAAGMSLLGEGWLLDAAADMALPLFDGGRRRANIDRSGAIVRERVAVFERTVMTAVKEVEDALAREERQEALVRETSLRLDAARITLEEAMRRYHWGDNNFDAVLTARTRIRDLEERIVEQQASRIQARIALYRALGGQWWQHLPVYVYEDE